jgi:hypothetical protein
MVPHVPAEIPVSHVNKTIFIECHGGWLQGADQGSGGLVAARLHHDCRSNLCTPRRRPPQLLRAAACAAMLDHNLVSTYLRELTSFTDR